MSLDDAAQRLAQERRSRLVKLLATFSLFTTTTSLSWIILISLLLVGVVGATRKIWPAYATRAGTELSSPAPRQTP